MVSKKKILDRLRTLRVEKDLRQEYVARRLGIDRTTYVRKEQGSIPITTEEWLKLADVMEEEPSYFFCVKPSALKKSNLENKERLFKEIYRSLSPQERDGLLSSLQLVIKALKRKGIEDAPESESGKLGLC